MRAPLLILLLAAALAGCPDPAGSASDPTPADEPDPDDDDDATGDDDATDDDDASPGDDDDAAALAEQYPGEIPVYEGTWDMPADPVELAPELPVTDEGQPVMPMPGGIDLVLDFDLRDPIRSGIECAEMIGTCFESGLRNYAGCFANAPKCATDEPWANGETYCCADACEGAYQALRESGMRASEAFVEAIYGEPSCMPGVDAFLAGEEE